MNPVLREIFAYAKARNWSDEKIAELSGFDPTTIRSWRRDQKQPLLSSASKLANSLGFILCLRRDQ